MHGDEDESSPPTEASRRFLEKFLQQVRAANLPGADVLIEKIEQALRRKRLRNQRSDGPDER